MSGAARRIERLWLTAVAEDGLARGRFLVEDAFRIATLPGESECRVLAIRRLELGVVDPDRSSAALAPVIEAAVRATAGRALRFDDPAAPAADAVYFPDALTAATAFVERLAGAASPMGWFWDTVFEGRIPLGEPEAAVRLALQRLLQLPGGSVHVAMLADVLRTRGTVDRFLDWLRPTDGARMLAALGLDAAPNSRGTSIEPNRESGTGAAEPGAERERDAPPFIPLSLRAWHPVLTAWTARWGEGDPRSRWLAAVALVSAQPSLVAHAELPVLIRHVLHAVRQAPLAADPARALQPLEPPRGRAPRARAAEAPDRSSSAAPARQIECIDGPSPEPVAGRSEPAAVEAGGTSETVTESPEPMIPSWDWDPHPTAAAGLLFVLPLLARLGIAEVLADNALLVEMQFPLRLLLFIADRVRVPDGDAVLAALAPTPLETLPTVRDDWDGVLASWLTRARRAAHRQARMGLLALVTRPGQVAATRTHIDIVVPLRELDLRVRRAGLDADPGWVPWLGRVVSFRYEADP